MIQCEYSPAFLPMLLILALPYWERLEERLPKLQRNERSSVISTMGFRVTGPIVVHTLWSGLKMMVHFSKTLVSS
jgi:cytochrome c oxidase assembly factor CtaG